ncbi:hypothetical protein ACHAPQ_005479 [Fusarium lateritium]
MGERCKSRNPKKPPSKEKSLGPSLLESLRKQVRCGEKAGTRQKRPQAVPRARPATEPSSIARVPTQSSGLSSSLPWSFNTTSAGAAVHNNQFVQPNTLLQNSFEHHDFFNTSHHSTTAAASFGSTSGDNSHNTSTSFTTQSTNLAESDLNNEGLLSDPSPPASWTQPWPQEASSIQEGLGRTSYQDYLNWYNPSAMAPAALGQHIQDITRDIQQSALPPAQELSPESESFRVKATYINGHQSRGVLQFDGLLQLNFVSQAFLSKLREDSQSPIDVVRTPPGYERWAFTPGGVMAPLEFYLWVYLEYESHSVRFPPSWVCLWVYHGTGAVDDTKITLGHTYFTTLEEQALM